MHRRWRKRPGGKNKAGPEGGAYRHGGPNAGGGAFAKRVAYAAVIIFLLASAAFAEDVSAIVEGLELDGLQKAADMLGADVDVRKTVMDIVSGETRLDGQFLADVWEKSGGLALSHIRDNLAAFLGPMF